MEIFIKPTTKKIIGKSFKGGMRIENKLMCSNLEDNELLLKITSNDNESQLQLTLNRFELKALKKSIENLNL